MRRAGGLRRLVLGLVLVGVAGTTAGCLLAPVPVPVAVGPPVVVAPRPVIVAPRPHPVYRGGYHGPYRRGHGHWR
jgi:hypothetical protein